MRFFIFQNTFSTPYDIQQSPPKYYIWLIDTPNVILCGIHLNELNRKKIQYKKYKCNS